MALATRDELVDLLDKITKAAPHCPKCFDKLDDEGASMRATSIARVKRIAELRAERDAGRRENAALKQTNRTCVADYAAKLVKYEERIEWLSVWPRRLCRDTVGENYWVETLRLEGGTERGSYFLTAIDTLDDAMKESK